MMLVHDLEQISRTVPCRKQQIELLSTLLGNKCTPAIPSLFIYGNTATGKSTTLKLVLQKLQHKFVAVSCVECYSSRLLFEMILGALQEKEDVERCDSLNDFVRALHLVAAEKYFNGDCIYIILEQAERLREFDANLLSGLLRLQELSDVNIGVILESEIVWEKFRSGTGFREPYILHFPDYTKEELVEIMSLDIQGNCPLGAYRTFISLLLNVFHHVCHNLRELRYLASINLKKYMEPVENGAATWDDVHKLWRMIEPHLKKSLQTVYLREISGVQWERMQQQEAGGDSSSQNSLIAFGRSAVELPVYSKYLLIAAYLASYNPAKSDKRYFTKNSGKIRKSAKTALKKNKERTSNQLLGPKVFPVDRLLAIFYSIVDDQVAPSASIFCQVTSLVTLGLLTQVSSTDSLQSPKYKCIISLEFIKSIARSVNFDVVRYIYDFV